MIKNLTLRKKKEIYIYSLENQKFAKTVGKLIVKSLYKTYNLIIMMFFLEQSVDMLADLNSTDNERLLRPFYTLTLILADDSKVTNHKKLLKYLLKTYLNLPSFVVYYKRFNFFSANKSNGSFLSLSGM